MKNNFPKKGSRDYWAGRLHKEFVDLMHPYFGMSSPEYAVIIFEERSFPLACLQYNDFGGPILLPGEKAKKEFEDYHDYINFSFTVYHESAHISHRGVTNFTEDNEGNGKLIELVGDISALLCIKEKKGEEIFQYSIAPSDSPLIEGYSFSNIDVGLMPLELARASKISSELLKKLVGIEMKQAQPILEELLGRSLS